MSSAITRIVENSSHIIHINNQVCNCQQSVLERRVSQFCFLGWRKEWLEIIFGNSELRVNRETV